MRSDDIKQDARLPGALAELTRVTLAKDVSSEGGIVPTGSTGTIMHAYPGGLAYEVEFVSPFHTVATVKADAIAA